MQGSTSNQGMFWSQARELFEQIVSWLDSDSICGLEHQGKPISNSIDKRVERYHHHVGINKQ